MMSCTSCARSFARSRAERAARTDMEDVFSPSDAKCRCLMPVRELIHSSEVSTNFARSKFVTTRVGA